MSFRWLRRDDSTAEGLRRIAREQVDKALDSAKAHDRAPDERVHEARRRGKKLRALLRLARPDFDAARPIGDRIGEAAASLSAARDANVMRQTLAKVMEWAGRPLPASPPHIESDAHVLGDFAREMNSLRAEIDGWPLDHVDRETVERGLERTYRAGRKRAKRCNRDDALDVDFHDWRKRTKAYTYQLLLFRELAGGELRSEIKDATELGDLLGEHHDLSVLRAELKRDPAQFGIQFDPDFARDAARRRQDRLEKQARKVGDRVYGWKPKALRDRFADYLDKWADRRKAA